LDHNEWMNDEVREQIEDLQSTHGFEEDEAVAFWHLQQAGKQINALWRADLREEMDRYGGQDDKEGSTRHYSTVLRSGITGFSNISQPCAGNWASACCGGTIQMDGLDSCRGSW
jgi:hypothetical protein